MTGDEEPSERWLGPHDPEVAMALDIPGIHKM